MRNPERLARQAAGGTPGTAMVEVRLDPEELAASGTVSPSSTEAAGMRVDPAVTRQKPTGAFLGKLKDFNFSKQERPEWVPLSEQIR